MNVLDFVLLLLAAISFLGAFLSWRSPNPPAYPNLVALGLLFWVLVPLIHAAKAL
jgi:CHASE2 domain-containing sensor protein